MGYLRRFHVGNGEINIKIRHRLYQWFQTIGTVLKIDEDMNVARISFKGPDGKDKRYWFHLFTGTVVSISKTPGVLPKEVSQYGEKAYYLIQEPIYPYDLDPTMDINYKKPEEIEDKDEETNSNESISRIE